MIKVVARADVICARACASPTRNDTEVCRVVDHRALSVLAGTLYCYMFCVEEYVGMFGMSIVHSVFFSTFVSIFLYASCSWC